jgi:CRP/FNR family transcriptional regulator, cyclic AMP receptor protein
MDSAEIAQIKKIIAAPALQALALNGVIRRYRKNAEILREGEPGDSMFIIISGKVQAYSGEVNGREVIFSIQSSGEYFGEMALDSGPRSASVRAMEATLCSMVTRRTVQAHFISHPEFATELISRLIHRIRMLTQTTRALALLGVYQRMADLFVRMAIASDDGHRIIVERMTHQRIAAHVGASREMVSKILKELHVGGYLKTENQRIVLMRDLPPGW